MDRFLTIASSIPDGTGCVYEVGCDHALITLAAFKLGKCNRAVVSDVSPECLNKAKVTLAGYPVDFYEHDGIIADTGAGAIVICGMGGRLISKMIGDYTGDAALILSPQQNPEAVRETLEIGGRKITKDFCFESNGKFYDLIVAEKGVMRLSSQELKFGAFYREKNPSLKKRLIKLLSKLEKCPDEKRIGDVKEALSWQQ